MKFAKFFAFVAAILTTSHSATAASSADIDKLTNYATVLGRAVLAETI